MSQKIPLKYALPAIILSTLLVVAIIYAWTEPTVAPPGGNVPAPLNVGSTGQSKAGGLILNIGGAATGLIIDKGNVGIGTTSPGAKLDVNGDIKWGINRGLLKTDQGASIELGGTGIPYIDFSNDAATDYDMRLRLTGDDALAIEGGNVGIGTTSPTQRLDVAGNIAASNVIFEGKSLKDCRICFKWAADDNTGQCNSVPWNGTTVGWGTVCAPIDSWTPRYRDDTDGRAGGCRLQWKLDCTPPYGD